MHSSPSSQSASAEQGGLQEPAPSQNWPCEQSVPRFSKPWEQRELVQISVVHSSPSLQSGPVTHCTQEPAPSQVPSAPQVDASRILFMRDGTLIMSTR